ncbi:hypothetical protein [Corynebacterium pelargi]|uniref:Uncharacterized protein n=1 Tax=Corynebacterium pelargi TaxID=1471400 RepID=A0A410W745_9CORY|nr:hypothetical protein [Corynebacterium pelargi]QAU51706.1 hypothetical protein CPELA_02040 [Corynebacterium pelargi]GGG80629.1 hypothetical protein GCM10007338_19010 [Corynebacterium pelargi]
MKQTPHYSRPQVGWAGVIVAVVASFLAVLIPVSVSKMLPPVAESNPSSDVVLGNEDAWQVKMTQADGEPLRCHKTSKGLLQGWDCDGTLVLKHTIAEYEDPALAIRRIIRGATYSELPEGKVENRNVQTVVRLDREEAHAIDPELADDAQITGLLVPRPDGLEGYSPVVLVIGDQDIADAVVDSVQAQTDPAQLEHGENNND